MLDNSLKQQVAGIFSGLDGLYRFDVRVSKQHESYAELMELLTDVASTSEKITIQETPADGLVFHLLKNDRPTGISFRGVPNGHEFTSLLLAILNSDGKGKNFPDAFISQRIKELKGPLNLSTYVSLTCTNCPDIVQSLNIMAILNPAISHEMVDGAINQQEVEALKLQGVPAVFADGQLLHVGRGELGELLTKLENLYGTDRSAVETHTREYDVVVVGGGPAGSAAAIYSARKGLKVAILAKTIGGQVKETLGIENLISVPKTTGEALANNLKRHIAEYNIDVFEHRSVMDVKVEEGKKVLYVDGGEVFSAPALIIATGAAWRRLNVPGESEYIGKGVAFCPHCDGPFYQGKQVAVVGGGNSGIEAAIDLAGICSKVTVLEFLDELKADKVLQAKARSLPNVEIILGVQTKEIIGNGEHVTAITFEHRNTKQETIKELNGVFIQIGLTPNSHVFKELVHTNYCGEIEVDSRCRTNIPGIYAAGDVATTPYKQIIIAMGEGAKAALTAFDDSIRNG